MSIRGIDAQMMVTRATEFVQSTNSQLKGAERAQDFLAVQKQSETEHDKASIVKTDESPEVELHMENEGGSGSEAYTSQQKGEQPVKDEYMELLEAPAGLSEHILDITL